MTQKEKLSEAYRMGELAEIYARKHEVLQEEAEAALEAMTFYSEKSVTLIREVLDA